MGVSSQGTQGAAGGAVAGASAGAMLGGPWGAVIGGVAGGVMGLVSGNSAAKKQKQAIDNYNKQIRVNAENNYQRLDIQEKEAAGAAREQLLDNSISMTAKRAQVEAMAAATGTAGGTLGTLVGDIYSEGGRNQAAIVDNYSREMTGFTVQADDVRRGAQAQLRSSQIQKPTAGEMLTTIAGAASQIYGNMGTAKQINNDLGSKYTLGQFKGSGANTKIN